MPYLYQCLKSPLASMEAQRLLETRRLIDRLPKDHQHLLKTGHLLSPLMLFVGYLLYSVCISSYLNPKTVHNLKQMSH